MFNLRLLELEIDPASGPRGKRWTQEGVPVESRSSGCGRDQIVDSGCREICEDWIHRTREKLARSFVSGSTGDDMFDPDEWHEQALEYWKNVKARVACVFVTDASAVDTHLRLLRVGQGLLSPSQKKNESALGAIERIVWDLRDWFKVVGVIDRLMSQILRSTISMVGSWGTSLV